VQDENPMTVLDAVEPMGIYETLYAFQEACGRAMGDVGTHPWSQGFPLTTQLPGGPPLPDSIPVSSNDRMYPKAWGNVPLRETIAEYYNTYYDAGIGADNVMVFAGGRPGILGVLTFLRRGVTVLIEETEYTPYWDVLRLTDRPYQVVPSNEGNDFRPGVGDYLSTGADLDRWFIIKSNPCNPTGRTLSVEELEDLVNTARGEGRGALIDEAYEFFVTGETQSAMRFLPDIDETNIFVCGAVTKGLQSPGTRIGWVIGSRDNIRTLGNFSSFAMGGVSRASQLDAVGLFEAERVRHARGAVRDFYTGQRMRYRTALEDLGVELFTGDGGFYHWGRLPGEMTAAEFNDRLFAHQAAILPGTLCDMLRRGDGSPLRQFFRFSFGPLPEESFDADVQILRDVLSS
jgi:aspartate/methionine/tyrosine aminotransferase